MTLRDLFRWAERYRQSNVDSEFYDWEQCIAEDGMHIVLNLIVVIIYTVNLITFVRFVPLG